MINVKTKGARVVMRDGVPKIFCVDTAVLDNHINNSVLNKIQGKSPTASKPIYSSQNPWTKQFVRNPNCWLNGVSNISCMSPAQLSGAWWNQRAGTLISPRHVILAKHFTIAILQGGTDILFVADDNTVVTRKLVSYILDPNSDIAIYLLDSDVPSNIKFAKVLHPAHAQYIARTDKVKYAVFSDQDEKALIGINTYLPKDPAPPGYQDVVYVQNPAYIYVAALQAQIDPAIPGFYETPVAGDSGDPMFLVIDNELVIISCWTTPVSGPDYPGRYRIINGLMKQLGGGYQLTAVDMKYVYNKYK